MRIRAFRKSRHRVDAQKMRDREFGAIGIGSWVIYWWGKDHWSENL